jgi:predicted DNA-binding transcriptional regulator AlpA
MGRILTEVKIREAHVEDAPTVVSETSLISARTVRAELGGISDMTLWRWLNRSDLGFPQPVVIARRRYWRRVDIETWKQNLKPASEPPFRYKK